MFRCDNSDIYLIFEFIKYDYKIDRSQNLDYEMK